MKLQPVILLTFSNDKDDYLPMLVKESNAIKNALVDYRDNNYLAIRDVHGASTEDIFYLANRYHNQIRILHYGGHANGTALQLEKAIGVIQIANVKGIAALLGLQQNLKLVFLNGCSTEGQVKTLLDSGVPVVIATNTSILDDMAQRFASQFYEGLKNNKTIREAYVTAKAYIETENTELEILNIEDARGILLRKENKSLPWGLYFQKDREGVLDWVLPTQSFFNIQLGNEKERTKKGLFPNRFLIRHTSIAIKESDAFKILKEHILKIREKGEEDRQPSDAELADTIFQAYPVPISIHLRALFSESLGYKLNVARLRKLVHAYHKIIEYLCYLLISEIWDKGEEKVRALDIKAEERLQLEALFHLNEQLKQSYNYFSLADALLQITHRNQISFFIDELKNLAINWQEQEVFVQAEKHFNWMHNALNEPISSELIESFCINSEIELTKILKELHFLTFYKLAVVKNIEVLQLKNITPTEYSHMIVELDDLNSTSAKKDRTRKLAKPTDMKSVLVYKGQLGGAFLSLSPFVLDENAIIQEINSKIYFFSHIGKEGLFFSHIGNSEEVEKQDMIPITNKNKFNLIYQQFELARRHLLNHDLTSKLSLNIEEDDMMKVVI